MTDLIQLRRGTAAAWTAANPTLADGEPGYETNTGREKRGDGATPWNLLRYIDDDALDATAIHVARVDNPHAVTKAQVNLGNVDNTSDANKPVSIAQAAADALRIPASLVDAKGDLLVGTANDTPGRLPIGTNGARLRPDTTQATGLKWSTALDLEGTGSPESAVTAPVGSTYTDTNATNGALMWIKATGTGNTGWDVLSGDTGRRNIAPSGAWTGTLWTRRRGRLVFWGGILTMPSTGIVIGAIPTGFAVEAGSIPNILGRNGTSGEINAVTASGVDLAWGGTLTAGNSLRFQSQYLTADPWPTSLPGTP